MLLQKDAQAEKNLIHKNYNGQTRQRECLWFVIHAQPEFQLRPVRDELATRNSGDTVWFKISSISRPPSPRLQLILSLPRFNALR